MKKFALSALGVLSGVSVFAEGTSGDVAYNGSVAQTIVTDASTTLTNFLTGAAPVIASIIVAGLAIWGGIALVGIIKKAFAVGKGR